MDHVGFVLVRVVCKVRKLSYLPGLADSLSLSVCVCLLY